jgi:hypothetical protein
MDRLPDFLEGAADLHVHSAPDIEPRKFDDFDLVREAAGAGMSAVLLKSHVSSTVERAFLVSKVVHGIDVYGGIVLNETVGGFNPAAVNAALSLGAKQIWMPTRTALNDRRFHGKPGGLTVLTQSGHLRPEVEAILEICARGNCVLGTGHLSPGEVFRLAERAKAVGVRRLLVTHPEWRATYYSIDMQKKLAALGNVSFERCFVSTTHRCGYTPMATIANAIADVGIATTVLSTDLGQPDTPAPVDGMRMYAAQLRSSGISADDLRRMMCENPLRLLAPARCANTRRDETTGVHAARE